MERLVPTPPLVVTMLPLKENDPKIVLLLRWEAIVSIGRAFAPYSGTHIHLVTKQVITVLDTPIDLCRQLNLDVTTDEL